MGPSEPTNALVRVEKWWRRGGYDDGQVLAFDTDWCFPYGTNHLTSVEVWASGAVYPSEKNPTPIAELVTKLSLAPHGTEVFMGRTNNNTYRIDWHDAHPNRDANQAADASVELFRNGDVIVREKGTTVVMSYVCTDDLDGDGIPNEDDENPLESDGYHFGPSNLLPPGCNSNAYYYVDVMGLGADAKITFVGDAPSDYPDPSFMAKSGTTNHVALLIGKSYEVVSREPFVCEGSSHESIEISTVGSSGNVRVCWPVQIDCVEDDSETSGLRGVSAHSGTGGGCRGSFSATVTPDWLGGAFVWASTSCCPLNGVGNRFTYGGRENCRCGGCITEGSYVYEGYRIPAWSSNCGCAPGNDQAPYLNGFSAPSIVCFPKGDSSVKTAQVTFEYLTDAAGTFTFAVSGDSVDVEDELGLSYGAGGGWAVSSAGIGQKTFLMSSTTKSQSPSGSHVSVNFTPESEGTSLSCECSVTFVEVSTTTFARKPLPRTRRKLGIGERIFIQMDPVIDGCLLSCSKSDSSLVRGPRPGTWNYQAGYSAGDDILQIAEGGPMVDLSVVEPSGYRASLKRIETTSTLGLSGSFSLEFDLELEPTDVSFAKLDVVEMGMVSSDAAGYFALQRNAHMLDHSLYGANVWSAVQEGVMLYDKATVCELPPPWGAGGSFTWPIPNKWRAKQNHSIDKVFCNTDQRFELDADGTARVIKFGWTGSCTTNRVQTYSHGGTP